MNELAVQGTNFFAGTSGGGVYRSTDGGSSWTAVGLTGGSVNAMAVSGTRLFAGKNQGEVYRSTDNGATWTPMNSGTPDHFLVHVLAASGTSLFAGTMFQGVWRCPI